MFKIRLLRFLASLLATLGLTGILFASLAAGECGGGGESGSMALLVDTLITAGTSKDLTIDNTGGGTLKLEKILNENGSIVETVGALCQKVLLSGEKCTGMKIKCLKKGEVNYTVEGNSDAVVASIKIKCD